MGGHAHGHVLCLKPLDIPKTEASFNYPLITVLITCHTHIHHLTRLHTHTHTQHKHRYTHSCGSLKVVGHLLTKQTGGNGGGGWRKGDVTWRRMWAVEEWGWDAPWQRVVTDEAPLLTSCWPQAGRWLPQRRPLNK